MTRKELENRTLSELKNDLQTLEESTVNALESVLNNEKYHVEISESNSIMMTKDTNNNTLFSVYDNFRVQFTKMNADKYESELLKDERFYTHMYKNKRFISAKAKDTKDFIDICLYCYKVADKYAENVKKATVTKKSEAKKEVTKKVATKKKEAKSEAK